MHGLVHGSVHGCMSGCMGGGDVMMCWGGLMQYHTTWIGGGGGWEWENYCIVEATNSQKHGRCELIR